MVLGGLSESAVRSPMEWPTCPFFRDQEKPRFLGDVWIDMGEDGADDVQHSEGYSAFADPHQLYQHLPSPKPTGLRWLEACSALRGFNW